jgi:hypothetical protein
VVLYLQAAIFSQGYYDFDLFHPVGQNFGGFPAVKIIRFPSIR